jgi:hypothetical protein
MVSTQAASQDTQGGAVVQVTPLVQRIVLKKNDYHEIAWSISVDKPATINQARTDCGCLTITTNLPINLKPGQEQKIEGIARGGLVGTKTISFLGIGVASEAKVTIEDPSGRGKPKEQFIELVRQATRKGSHVTVLAHDVRDGSYSPCQCANEPLGGAERLKAIARITNGLTPRPKLWLTGLVDSEKESKEVGRLLAQGWRQPPDNAVIISQRPHIAAQKAPTALVIPRGSRGGGHQRILDPWPGMGSTIIVVVRKANGRIESKKPFLLSGNW